MLIDPYPYRDAMRMVHIHLYDKDPAPYDLALDGPQFASFEKSSVLDGAIAQDVYTMALSSGNLPQQLQVGRMSQNAFTYFGVPALVGRAFSTSDKANVAVLSYSFWQSHFAARPDVWVANGLQPACSPALRCLAAHLLSAGCTALNLTLWPKERGR